MELSRRELVKVHKSRNVVDDFGCISLLLFGLVGGNGSYL